MSINKRDIYDTLTSVKKNLKQRKPYFFDDKSYLEYLRRTRTDKEEIRERVAVAEYLVGRKNAGNGIHI